MSSKHIFQSTDDLVLRSLRGAVALNKSLALDSRHKAVYVRGLNQDTRVALVAGGGAGHEPAHVGYTGRGMLSASVSGDIFASSGAHQIMATMWHATTGGSSITTPQKDILVIINNYTGDRLNFGLAIEKATKEWPGVKIDSVVVADDVSLLDRQSAVGPRGLAGNILVCKLLGAFAGRGNDLRAVKALGDAVVDNLAGIGVGLAHCHLPGQEGESLNLKEDECEIGLGLHNEAGVKKTRLDNPTTLVAEIIRLLRRGGRKEDDGSQVIFMNDQDEYILVLNNLGGISQLEMGAVLDETLVQLRDEGIKPTRIYMSSFMTSLNAPGFSISILNASGAERKVSESSIAQVNIVELCDDQTEAIAWPRSHICHQDCHPERQTEVLNDAPMVQQNQTATRGLTWKAVDVSPFAVLRGVRGASKAVLASASDMTEFDTITGDGDCGDTFTKGAKAVLQLCDEIEPTITSISLAELVGRLGTTLENSMGGTIGALFAIFLTAWSERLANPQRQYSNWLSASMNQALETLFKYTPARPGDRTVIDALQPLIQALESKKPMKEVLMTTRQGAESTRGMEPKLGRAVYVTSGLESCMLPPDPGAWGIAAMTEGYCAGYAD